MTTIRNNFIKTAKVYGLTIEDCGVGQEIYAYSQGHQTLCIIYSPDETKPFSVWDGRDLIGEYYCCETAIKWLIRQK